MQTGVHSEEEATIKGKLSNAREGRDAGQGVQISSGTVMPRREDEGVDAR